ncbi:MAG: helix-turn-helix domain-containing protein [Syntrophothermus sp.]
MKNRIRDLRNERGMTANELGKIFKLSEPAILKYEKGLREPKLETLTKIARYFDVSMEYLLCQTDIREESEIEVPLKKFVNDENKHVIPPGFDIEEPYIGIIKEAINRKITPEELRLIIEMWTQAKQKSPPRKTDSEPTNKI